jgi:hypothetical protein
VLITDKQIDDPIADERARNTYVTSEIIGGTDWVRTSDLALMKYIR